jgi:cbb3-type cytochrome oxidase maturation protein
VSVIYVILPAVLVVVGIAVAAYVWAAKHGQFDDMETPAMRMLNDDAPGSPAAPKSPGAEADAEP